MMQRLTPGMKHGEEPDLGAEMFGIGGDGVQRLGGGPEQNGVDRLLVLEGNLGHWRRQREDDMGLSGISCLRPSFSPRAKNIRQPPERGEFR